MATKVDTSSSIDTSKFAPAGMNVRYLVADGILFIAVPVDEKALAAARPSTSGKNKTVGSTLGNVGIPNIPGMKLGLNVYVPNVAG